MIIVSDRTDSPLLPVDGSVNHQVRPVNRSSSGGWRSASFIIGVEVAERFAYCGISSNLISYLTGPLGQSTAAAAANVNLWSGIAMFLPLVGAFVADTFLGRYRTIVVASLVYIMGLSLLTLSVMLPSLRNPGCQRTAIELSSCSPPKLQAFGADQFDEQDAAERKAKSSFFNWWFFGICGGSLATSLILNYIQDYLSWGLGFGIPALVMMVALFIFLLGTRTYRYSSIGDEKSPLGRIGRVFAAAARNWQTTSSVIAIEEETRGTLPHQSFEQFKFLNKALISPDGSHEDGKVLTIGEVEEAKSVLRLIPIWAICSVHAIVYAQINTFFTKQGVTMDRSIPLGITLSAASLQSFTAVSVVLFVPIYDAIFVPVARSLTGKPSGITMLQRIGIGLFLSVISMVVAAVVEAKRLEIARYYELVDLPNVTVPMRIWWLVPQYVLFGVGDVFTVVGQQEFFYSQVPDELRSIGLALYLSIFGTGSFLSSFLVSAIDELTGGDGIDSWFADNLNRAHLDYFYWLLAGFSFLGFASFLYLAKSYIYTKKSTI